MGFVFKNISLDNIEIISNMVQFSCLKNNIKGLALNSLLVFFKINFLYLNPNISLELI